MTSRIEQQVMAGVAAVHVARKLTSRTALECYALFACSFSLTLLVSLPNVVRNLWGVEHSGPSALGTFFFAALLNTSHVVQALVAVGALLLALLVADTLRSVRAPSALRAI